MIHQGLTISGVDQFAGLVRQGVTFRECNFDEANLMGFEADALELEQCSLRGVRLNKLFCPELKLIDCDLHEANFERADVQDAEFTNSEFAQAIFRGAKLNLSRLVDCDFSACNFDGAVLFGAELTRCRFRAVDFSSTNVDGAKFDHVDFSMAALRFKDFKGKRLIGMNFTEADLTGSNFTGAIFEECHLAGVHVSKETLFDGADFRGAFIAASQLELASIRGAMMSPVQANLLLYERFGIVVDEGS